MAYEIRITAFPDVPVSDDGRGGFAPDSFTDLMHLEVELPGLDRAWHHTLVGVAVAADRNSAELTVHSTPRAPKSLDRGLRLSTWLPAAHIKAHDENGTELVVAKLDAPLQVGEHAEMWPHRHADSGSCHKGIDYQHVTLTSDPAPVHQPTAARE